MNFSKKNKIIKNLFFKLLRIREIEKSISQEYHKQRMRCPVHLSIGQESIAVAISENLKKEDEVVTAHRSHAHYLAKGGDLKKMISELHGKVTGCAKGKGGSMHLMDLRANVVAAVPIVGSTIPIGVGKAWANKLKNNKNIVVIYFGDGATEEGVFFESLDFSALHSLRVLFVCENNKYSVFSHIKKRQSVNRNLIKISNSFGIKSIKIKDHDMLNIFEVSQKLIKSLRKSSKPVLLEIDTFRQIEHCGPNFDSYLKEQDSKEFLIWKKKDQVNKYYDYLLKKKIFSKKLFNRYLLRIRKEIKSAFFYALQSQFPKKKDLFEDIYKKKI